MKSLLIMAIVILIVCSCNQESVNCGDPIPEICTLILVDHSDKLLVGTTYLEDNIKLSVAGQAIPLSFENGKISFQYSTFKQFNQQDYILKLTENDSDTLNLIIRTYSTECFNSQILDTLKYNKVVMSTITGSTYKIIK
jgi:hypothetical protein